MEPFESNTPGKIVGSQSPEADALAREIMAHREEDKNRSYLSKLIVGVTESFTGKNKSFERMDALRQKAMLSRLVGDNRTESELQQQMKEAVSQDIDARKSASNWNNHTANFLKSVGLFFPGKGGYAVSALTNAADAARPSDSYMRQGADLALGAGKGAALKWGFDKIGQTEWNLAVKAGALSFTNRFAELGLNSHAYFSKTGEFDPLGGFWKAAAAIGDPYQLGNDMLTFGAGYFALKKLGLSPDFAKNNPMLAQMFTGAGFGFSNGFFANVQLQNKLGEGFSLGDALKSGVIQMGLDGAAAAIGGARMQQLRNNALRADLSESPQAMASLRDTPLRLDMSKVVGVYGLDNKPIARPHSLQISQTKLESSGALSAQPEITPKGASSVHISEQARVVDTRKQGLPELADIPKPRSLLSRSAAPAVGSGVRDFVTRENVSGLIPSLKEQGLSARALLTVQEVLKTGDGSAPKLGPEKKLLIEHLEPGMKPAVERMSASDLLATCNPEVLKRLGLDGLVSKHLFPDAGSSKILLQVPGSNRLRFSLPEALKNSEHAGQPVLELGREKTNPESGMTVSQWLRSLDKKDRMSDLHDVSLIARAMEHYKAPIKRFLGGGNETIAFEMQDGKILRVTEKDFRPEWGTRTLDLNGKEVRFDASILGKRMQVRMGDEIVNYYEQHKGITPVSVEDMRYFQHLVDKDGRYIFWDNDGGMWGQSQLAYVPLLKLPSGILSAIPVSSRAGLSNRGMALIDYDAVRITGTEPKHQDARSWRYGNYDFEPFDK